MERVGISVRNVDPETWLAFRMAALARRQNISQAIEEAIRLYVEKGKNEPDSQGGNSPERKAGTVS